MRSTLLSILVILLLPCKLKKTTLRELHMKQLNTVLSLTDYLSEVRNLSLYYIRCKNNYPNKNMHEKADVNPYHGNKYNTHKYVGVCACNHVNTYTP